MSAFLSISSSLIAVVALVLLVFAGVEAANLHYLFGVIVPYAALVVFMLGVVYRILKWARSPVPFRIPTTCGQQKSHPWIKANHLENPSGTPGVIGRMALEVLLFRSLFRNTKVDLRDGGSKIAYGSDKVLWLAAIVFHWSFLTVFVRHLRFFLEPVPTALAVLERVDALMQLGVPALYISGAVLVASAAYLLFRRIAIPQVRYISLPADYFPLFVILGIGITGILMRYFLRVDITGVKVLTMGLAGLRPTFPDGTLQGISVTFYIHLFLICVLFAYFPFSKLMHLGGVFLSPTRNLANTNRTEQHVNPWNYDVKVHTYQEYEDEFRQKMKAAGLPLEKE